MLGNIQKSKIAIFVVIGAIAAIALTVFVTKPLSHDTKSNTETNSQSSTYNAYHEHEKTSSQAQHTTQKYQENNLSIAHTCEQDCEDIILLLEIGEPLSAQNIAFIIKNASVVANALVDVPDAISNLLAALQDDESDKVNQHDAAYAIVEALSLEQKIEVASLIKDNIKPNDRVSALKLLQPGIKNNEQAVDLFVSILTDEYDTSVQIIAINMAHQVSGEHNQEKARQALNNIIQSTSSSYTSGEALLAKISISPSPSLVAQDINDFVSSSSPEHQKYGLQAIKTSMERYHAEFDAGNTWQESEAMQASIVAITQDEDISINLRNQAQDILEQFF